MKIAIFYGSTLGNTERVANQIYEKFNDCECVLFNIKDLNSSNEEIGEYDLYIFGTSTWGVGDMQDDWEEFDFKRINVENKFVALFGLGDSEVYSWTYCDALLKIHRIFKMKKAKIIGYVSTQDYKFAKSEAVENDKFLGLALDEDNYEDLTEERIDNWVKQLKKEVSI